MFFTSSEKYLETKNLFTIPKHFYAHSGLAIQILVCGELSVDPLMGGGSPPKCQPDANAAHDSYLTNKVHLQILCLKTILTVINNVLILSNHPD